MFSIKKLFCKIGIHWMENHHSYLWDYIGGTPIFSAECPCGRKWMVESAFPIVTFKVERN